ncbi:hypothetical protein ACI8AG_20490, partial [Blastococcus sp. SYSU DS0552]
MTGRRVESGLEYRPRVRVLPDGRVAVALSRLAGGVESFPGGEVFVPGLTWAPETVLEVRLQVTGTSPTELALSVWAAGTAEPAGPAMTWTDDTAGLQVAGSVGLTAHRPGSSTAA